MCGISAIFAVQNKINVQDSILKMNQAIRHRGPDDEGYVFFDGCDHCAICVGGTDTPDIVYKSNVQYTPMNPRLPISDSIAALGHRRLAIIDLSPTGHQPLSFDKDRYWISYNGEIYNYQELRNELIKLGYCFVSHSDTEVILASYVQWGENCLERFNGMWAFIIVDRVTGDVFVARDRFGVKPLYFFSLSGCYLAFASEIKQFSVLPGWNAKINAQRAYDFLNWGMADHTCETMFKGVYQLRGGELAKFNLADIPEHLQVYRWYEVEPRTFSGDFEKAASEFCKLFSHSVRLRLRADVSIGSCLSGGLDSSAIVCVANDILNSIQNSSAQTTFSACSFFKEYDEREYIEEVVNSRNIKAHYVYPQSKELFDNLDNLTWHQDEPFGTTSIFAQWSVFKLAAESGIKVMLDGQGSDEYLAGYTGFFAPYWNSLIRKNKWTEIAQEYRAMKDLHNISLKNMIMQTANLSLPQNCLQPFKKILGKTQTEPDWICMNALSAEPTNPYQNYHVTNISEHSAMLLTYSNLPKLLHWEDRNSMFHSIESRVPFLDYRLVEFVTGLIDEYKLHRGVTKKVLRYGLSGILPNRIRDRVDKMGFLTPEAVWACTESSKTFKEELKKTTEITNGIINSNIIQRFEGYCDGSSPYNSLIWRAISFGRWMNKFNCDI